MNTLETGKKAPAFSGTDQNGVTRTLKEFSGRKLVLYFYPKDDTPGCTKQACTFRDDLHQLTDLGAEVVGVSVDNASSHADFARKYHLQFPLLADHQAEVALRYHSLIDLGMFKFARRNTFLIDPQGNIAKIYLSASARRNANEVITDLKHIQATE